MELLSGPHIVLHIKFMFRVFGKNLLIMNTCNNGRWDQEVQLDSPLKKGENFHLKIKFEQYGYKVPFTIYSFQLIFWAVVRIYSFVDVGTQKHLQPISGKNTFRKL